MYGVCVCARVSGVCVWCLCMCVCVYMCELLALPNHWTNKAKIWYVFSKYPCECCSSYMCVTVGVINPSHTHKSYLDFQKLIKGLMRLKFCI